MKRKTAWVAALLAAGAAGSAQAQDGTMMSPWPRASRFDLGVYVGGSYTTSWFESRTVKVAGGVATNQGGADSYKPGYAPIAGLEATYWLSPTFGMRAHGAYAPMRVPNTGGGFEDVTDRHSYGLNTYIYDLDLMLRPFVRSPGWFSSAYLFAGGGGLTTDVAGRSGPGCEATALAQGACIATERGDATVGQATAGVGMDLVHIGRSLGVFGELGFHGYDSPAHVGGGWLPVVTVPSGGTVRVADDRNAVTSRLVIGLKYMAGNLLPPPMQTPPPPPPPPPAPAPMPMPTPEMRDVQVCVVQGNALAMVMGRMNPATGDTTVNGQAFAAAYPATAGYASGATWFINNETVTYMGKRFEKYGLPRVLSASDVTRAGEFQGVGVFTQTGVSGTPDVVYVPTRPGCEFQPYQNAVDIRTVRG